MTFARGSVDLQAALRTVPAAVNYPHVGATRGVMPPGWRHVDRTWALPDGSFERAAACVLSLDVLRSAGLRVAADPLRAGAPVVQALPVGPAVLLVPCRVAYVREEPDAQGFAYGTVDGHPERGEEAFLVARTPAGTTLTIRSFTRPGSRWVAAGWPLARVAVSIAVGRYGAAVQRACR